MEEGKETEKKGCLSVIIVCIVLTVGLDIVAGFVGLQAKAAQQDVKHNRVWLLECKAPSKTAFVLGIIAVSCLAAAHVIANVIGCSISNLFPALGAVPKITTYFNIACFCLNCAYMRSPLCDPLAMLYLQCACDWNLHSETVKHHNDSRIPLCNNCVSQTAGVQCLERGLYLCHTCAFGPNRSSLFFLLQNGSNYNSAYNCLGFDSYSSSSSSSFVDRNWQFSYGSLPLINEDSSSSFEIFQIDENYTKNNYSDQQVPMLQPDNLEIPKDSSCSDFNGYETKKDIENVLLNTFDGEEAVLDLTEYNPDEGLILTDPLIDELTKHNAETTSTKVISSSSSGMSSVLHKDYNIEALANAGSQDYYINQRIESKAKEETNNLAIFPNALVQLDCGQSQLILTDEMSPWDNQTYVPVKRYTPQAREEALKRYFAKKKKRKFGKQIRYESRKSTADTKRRMKGRFTKAGAEYDYDPRANNIKKGTNKIMANDNQAQF